MLDHTKPHNMITGVAFTHYRNFIIYEGLCKFENNATNRGRRDAAAKALTEALRVGTVKAAKRTTNTLYEKWIRVWTAQSAKAQKEAKKKRGASTDMGGSAGGYDGSSYDERDPRHRSRGRKY